MRVNFNLQNLRFSLFSHVTLLIGPSVLAGNMKETNAQKDDDIVSAERPVSAHLRVSSYR